MVRLTAEMKAAFEKQLAVIATSSGDGTPNVGPKGSMHVIDDETLAYSESTGKRTLRNLQENPKVAVLVMDHVKREGFQVKGIAELLTSGDLFQQVARRQEIKKRPQPKLVVRIRVEEIHPI